MKESKYWIIYFVILFSDLSGSILIFGGTLLSSTLGASTTEIGLVGSAVGISYLFSPAVLGRLGDKMSKKICLIISAFCQIGCAVAIQYSDSVLSIFLCVFCYGIAIGMYWPIIESYVSGYTETSKKTHFNGISNYALSWSLGFSIGPLIIGTFGENVKLAFNVSVILFLIVISIIVFLLPNEAKKQDLKKKHIGNAESIENADNIEFVEDIKDNLINKDTNINKYRENGELSKIFTIPRHIPYRTFLLLIMLTMLMNGVYANFLLGYFPNYAVNSNGLNWNVNLTGNVVFSYGLGRTFYFLIGRTLRNSFKNILYATISMSVLIFMMIFIRSPILFVVTFLVFGFNVGQTYLISLNLLMYYEKEEKGKKAGFLESAIGMGTALTPVIAGWLGSFSLFLPFIVFALISIPVIILYIWQESKEKSLTH